MIHTQQPLVNVVQSTENSSNPARPPGPGNDSLTRVCRSAGCIYAELKEHRRPFPKRRAIPFDRWRNSGGKRGSTTVRGQQLTMLRRYGNVVRHNKPPVRYVEYSVLSAEPTTPNHEVPKRPVFFVRPIYLLG